MISSISRSILTLLRSSPWLKWSKISLFFVDPMTRSNFQFSSSSQIELGRGRIVKLINFWLIRRVEEFFAEWKISKSLVSNRPWSEFLRLASLGNLTSGNFTGISWHNRFFCILWIASKCLIGGTWQWKGKFWENLLEELQYFDFSSHKNSVKREETVHGRALQPEISRRIPCSALPLIKAPTFLKNQTFFKTS